MGTITILSETTKTPITLIGNRAGICWGADVTNIEKIINVVLTVLNLVMDVHLNFLMFIW